MPTVRICIEECTGAKLHAQHNDKSNYLILAIIVSIFCYFHNKIQDLRVLTDFKEARNHGPSKLTVFLAKIIVLPELLLESAT